MKRDDLHFKLTHFDSGGKARMVDVSDKDVTYREAVARGRITMMTDTLKIISEGGTAKGDVLGVARIAGIMAAKKTVDYIPLAHPLPITGVEVDFLPVPPDVLEIEARVSTLAKTGVEMEALTAVGIAALTVYDMCKSVDRSMVIRDIRLVKKSGGRSGEFKRNGERLWEQ